MILLLVLKHSGVLKRTMGYYLIRLRGGWDRRHEECFVILVEAPIVRYPMVDAFQTGEEVEGVGFIVLSRKVIILSIGTAAYKKT